MDETLRQICIQFKVISCIHIPVVKGDKVAGLLCFCQSTPRTWTDAEIQLASEIAARTWSAVERLKAEEALRVSEQEARGLVTKLEIADKNKSYFLSVLSHELRNPLAAISAGIQVLDVTQDSNQAAKVKEIINRQTDQLCKLVDDLLDLTRINENKMKLRKKNINLNEVVEHAIEDIRFEFEKKGVELETEIQTKQILLYADPVRLVQCIGNLLNNALKFTEKNGKVWVRLKQENDDARIIVEDSGIGIAPEILPLLFWPFIQADSSLDSNGGLGLGLPIAKGIVDLHEGTISAHSAGLGKGATFTIRLPLITTDGPFMPEQQLPEHNDKRIRSD
ncbi:Sensor histidine kinase RcsC [bioreactor metagenome]|uniref:histidine kinase n=1 Tax=bioreactor metagenome TaxID=1076179 RepID=A0A644ZGV5_9ZZZZ